MYFQTIKTIYNVSQHCFSLTIVLCFSIDSLTVLLTPGVYKTLTFARPSLLKLINVCPLFIFKGVLANQWIDKLNSSVSVFDSEESIRADEKRSTSLKSASNCE